MREVRVKRLSKWPVVACGLVLAVGLAAPSFATTAQYNNWNGNVSGAYPFRINTWKGPYAPANSEAIYTLNGDNSLTLTAVAQGAWSGAYWNTNSRGGPNPLVGPLNVDFRGTPQTTWFEASFIDTGQFDRVQFALDDGAPGAPSPPSPDSGWAQFATTSSGYECSYWASMYSTTPVFAQSAPEARTPGPNEVVTVKLGLRPDGTLDYWVNGVLVYADHTLYTSDPASTRYFTRAYFTVTDRAADSGLDSVTFTHFAAGNGYDYTGPDPVPEPFSMVMLGCLGGGMALARKLRRKKA